ncbi:hypothetical protein E8E13_009609 [Curvularia kusanoi]|uniref:Uncharacterized protein n=1 Tax=Curvularia kusanoi TaxID=90978 RepID=A0A9P4TCN8_CURKU|nr:hypothetical protein E8E13_009609 [Curvularia kusanoi]
MPFVFNTRTTDDITPTVLPSGPDPMCAALKGRIFRAASFVAFINRNRRPATEPLEGTITQMSTQPAVLLSQFRQFGTKLTGFWISTIDAVRIASEHSLETQVLLAADFAANYHDACLWCRVCRGSTEALLAEDTSHHFLCVQTARATDNPPFCQFCTCFVPDPVFDAARGGALGCE